jgi:dienelactone hydrolase
VTRLPALLLALLALARPHPALAQGGDIIERDTVVTTGAIKLPATLTLPAGAARAPAVVLVHGSGPNDRDETVGANKPFRDLAHGLARKGIVVIRYEKRSRAAPLSFMGRRFTVDDEVVDDALSAAALLRGLPEVDPARVVVLGHSLGGTLAPRIGQRDTALAGLVILAGATRPLTDMIEAQFAYLRSLPGADTAAMDKALAGMAPGLAAVRALTPADSGATAVFFGAPAGYWLDLAGYDPVRVAETLPMPILILQGGRDYQVTAKDLDRWKTALQGAPYAKFQTFPKASHLFVLGEGPSLPAEYQETANVAGEVVDAIAKWLKGLPPRK